MGCSGWEAGNFGFETEEGWKKILKEGAFPKGVPLLKGGRLEKLRYIFMRPNSNKTSRHRLGLVKTSKYGHLEPLNNAKNQSFLRQSNQGGLPKLLPILQYNSSMLQFDE